MMRFLQGSGKPDLAIDFGTANTRVVTADGGIAFDEPSLCCFAKGTEPGKLVAAGTEAMAMKDRICSNLRTVRPLNRGVLSDIPAAREYLSYAVRKSVGQRRLRSFRALIGVPADATNAERGALLTAASDAGLGAVTLVPEPFAAAWGAGLPVDGAQGSMIVECGAGTTEAMVLALGGSCAAAAHRGGGDALDTAIADHLHFQHKFLIGPTTAERIKREIVGLDPEKASADAEILIKGRNLATGLPQVIALPVQTLLPVAEKHVASITKLVVDLLRQLPPELSRDIHNNGIMLTGGSAAIRMIRSALVKATELPVTVAGNAAHCVAAGLHRRLLQ